MYGPPPSWSAPQRMAFRFRTSSRASARPGPGVRETIRSAHSQSSRNVSIIWSLFTGLPILVKWRAACHLAIAPRLLPTVQNEASTVSYPLFFAKLLIRSRIARFLPAVRRLTNGGSRFLHYYSNRILMAPHAELLQAADLLAARGPDALDLASGSPSFDIVP